MSTSTVPWFPLGADPLGRDVFSRIADGSRRSLSVALAAVMLSLTVGGIAGAVAGYAGGLADRIIATIADFVVILPDGLRPRDAARGPTSGHDPIRGVLDDGGRAGGGVMAAAGARSARDRCGRATALVRRSWRTRRGPAR